MSTQHIINILKNLVKAQKGLLETSIQKTEEIKAGQVDQLQATLIKERKALHNIEQIESKRIEAVNQWFVEYSLPLEQATITEMLENLTNEHDKNELEIVATDLTETILKLKQQEQLNQALIQQSMQFVQLSLDLLNPSITNMNYSGKKETSQIKRSMFDSQA